MGCGCGGAKVSPAIAVPRPPEQRGPQAPGYAWTGPQKRAALAEKRARKNPKKPV